MKDSINLKIKNNTSLPQEINILGITTPYQFANVSNTIYEYNLSAEDFLAVTTVELQYEVLATTLIYLPTTNLLTNNIQGVVDALNTFNVGLFSYLGNVVYVSSSIYAYYKITIA